MRVEMMRIKNFEYHFNVILIKRTLEEKKNLKFKICLKRPDKIVQLCLFLILSYFLGLVFIGDVST